MPTFSRLDTEDLARLERSIVRDSRRTPVGVIAPALFTDLASPAVERIIAALSAMAFVKRVYVSLDHAFVEYNDLLFGSPLIPDWRRIEAALEGTLIELAAAFDDTANA